MTERREWLVRCEFEDDDMAVCAVEASWGQVGIYAPDHSHFLLSVSQSREFADALGQATAMAERDARVRRERSGLPSGTP